MKQFMFIFILMCFCLYAPYYTWKNPNMFSVGQTHANEYMEVCEMKAVPVGKFTQQKQVCKKYVEVE